jgi:hypothetical protein
MAAEPKPSSALDRLQKAKAAAAAGGDKPRPKAYSLADEEADAPKIMLYGPSGVGKSFFLLGPILAGERVFVLSTDFGTNGLITIKNELKRLGRRDLLKNLRGIDLNTYEDVESLFENPLELVPDFYQFDPGVIAWEGFSYFNGTILDEYILKHAPGAANAGELRQSGFTHTTQDWQGMHRGTMRPLGKFFALQTLTRRPAKILTCMERGDLDVNELSGNKAEKTVLVQGGARKQMGGGFDVIMVAASKETSEGVEYFYRCKGDSSKYLVKARGYNLQPIEPADPERIWRVIRAEGGGKSDEVKDAA